jgi:alpha-ketoglutarate-dependent taurine dioxygenase|tara:strand:+ start:6454 stop:7452 length:999 start_codon:yes stop_codon:yes gene_type:complete
MQLRQSKPITVAPRIFDDWVRGKIAWKRATIDKSDYFVTIPSEVQNEISAFVDTLRANPMETVVLTPGDYQLRRTKDFIKGVRHRLDAGVGFAVLDRLSIKKFNKSELRAIYWVLSSLIARPVAQSFDGTLLYDVIDTGKKKGPKVRADVTSAELDFHTDYSYNRPPRYFGLQALRTAKRGGRSGAVSLMTAHNEMRKRNPGLLERLYQPFWINRYNEHAPSEPPASFHPVFEYDGSELLARFNPRNIYAGYNIAGKELDAKGQEAIEALNGIMTETSMHVNFHLAAGQTVYFHNGRCAHCRTAYEDFDEPERRRHMIRIFLRDDGARTYNG